MSDEEEVMRLVKSRVDPTADGTAVRIMVGKPMDDISGAIYLKKGVPLPKSILVAIPQLDGSVASQDVLEEEK